MNKTTTTIAATAVAALVIGGGIGYAAHTSSSSTAAPQSTSSSLTTVANRGSATQHNAQDVSFAQDMIAHHQQAIEMAKLAATRADSSKVGVLASAIEDAQDPEIRTMSDWLATWGASVDSTTSGMSTMDHSSMGSGSMTGMMSDSDMAKLATLTGAEFDKQFLSMMTEHHTGAITMAKQELANGQYGDALALAASIAVSQQAQISEMQQLLKQT